MAVVYVAARIKAGSSVSPFERCNKEIHRPLRHLATGCLLLPHTWPACFFSTPPPPSHPTPSPCSVSPFFSISLRLYRIEGSLFLSRFPFIREQWRYQRCADTRRPRSCNPFLEWVCSNLRAGSPFFCQGLRGW